MTNYFSSCARPEGRRVLAISQIHHSSLIPLRSTCQESLCRTDSHNNVSKRSKPVARPGHQISSFGVMELCTMIYPTIPKAPYQPGEVHFVESDLTKVNTSISLQRGRHQQRMVNCLLVPGHISGSNSNKLQYINLHLLLLTDIYIQLLIINRHHLSGIRTYRSTNVVTIFCFIRYCLFFMFDTIRKSYIVPNFTWQYPRCSCT